MKTDPCSSSVFIRVLQVRSDRDNLCVWSFRCHSNHVVASLPLGIPFATRFRQQPPGVRGGRPNLDQEVLISIPVKNQLGFALVSEPDHWNGPAIDVRVSILAADSQDRVSSTRISSDD